MLTERSFRLPEAAGRCRRQHVDRTLEMAPAATPYLQKPESSAFLLAEADPRQPTADLAHADSCSSNPLASFSTGVSNPSVNQL
jgi:hypothetical protein